MHFATVTSPNIWCQTRVLAESLRRQGLYVTGHQLELLGYFQEP